MALTELAQHWWIVLAAYILGATPFGFLAGKLRGLDIRKHGSGNIGATNVVRTLGKPVGITVLLMDVCKGLVPVLIAKSLSDSSLLPIATAVAAILGHNYTFWLKFKGGKGIATTGGAILPIMPFALVAAVSAWMIVFQISKYVSLASIAAALIIPLTIVMRFLITGDWDFVILELGLFVSVLAIWKHRSNIGRLRRGEEPRSGSK